MTTTTLLPGAENQDSTLRDWRLAARYFDHTLLSADSTRNQVIRICEEAIFYGFATVFVHPLQPACCTNVVPGVPDVVVEYGTETSRTIASLLMSHTTIKFPDIRFIFSHGGGDVPFLTFRFQRMVSGDPELMKDNPGGAITLLQKMYFDTAQSWNQYSLPSLTKLMPVDHIVFGSDFPAASPLDTVNGLRAFGLSADALARIERQNAASILAHMT